MFDKSRGFFSANSNESSELSKESDELRVAILSLLISAANSDDNFSQNEYNLITSIATAKLGLDQKKTQELLSTEQNHEIVSETILELRNSLNSAQRENIFSLICSIISSDCLLDDAESKFAMKLQSELDLTLEQAIRARKKSEHLVIDGFKEFVEASPQVVSHTKKWTEKSD